MTAAAREIAGRLCGLRAGLGDTPYTRQDCRISLRREARREDPPRLLEQSPARGVEKAPGALPPGAHVCLVVESWLQKEVVADSERSGMSAPAEGEVGAC